LQYLIVIVQVMNVDQHYEALAKAIHDADTIPPCQVTDPEIWFADHESAIYEHRVAKKFCESCPVKVPCRDYAIVAVEAFGIWGGTTPRERQAVRVGLKRKK
jgi:hypothetical protein